MGADYHQQGRDTGRVLYAPRLQIVATLPALVLLVVRRQRGGLPHQKVGKSGMIMIRGEEVTLG